MGFSLVLEKRSLGLEALERRLAGLVDLRTREHETGRLGDWETGRLGDCEAGRLRK